jgi:hypothetical protein
LAPEDLLLSHQAAEISQFIEHGNSKSQLFLFSLINSLSVLSVRFFGKSFFIHMISSFVATLFLSRLE